ncbi:hypothetical protein CHARACLAT_014100 [Characodon lateralis]|uniref:SET domain-containing protein n=1 Tax=Characodon lateralis TaxID=208331 RepID=A0ABU7EWR0_9TELE|nr:hypothetical protein [Characodon lateralis]
MIPQYIYIYFSHTSKPTLILSFCFSFTFPGCEECLPLFQDQRNPDHINGPSFVLDFPTTMGVSQRALLTLPFGLMIGRSSIPSAGVGVINQGPGLSPGMHFGPYEGNVTTKENAMTSDFSWEVSYSPLPTNPHPVNLSHILSCHINKHPCILLWVCVTAQCKVVPNCGVEEKSSMVFILFLQMNIKKVKCAFVLKSESFLFTKSANTLVRDSVSHK